MFSKKMILEDMKEIREKCTSIRENLRRLLRENNSILDTEKSDDLKSLKKKAENSTKRIKEKPEDYSVDGIRKQQVLSHWSNYLKKLYQVYESVLRSGEEVEGVDESAIHGMSWENEEGDEEESYTERIYTKKQVWDYITSVYRKCQAGDIELKNKGFKPDPQVEAAFKSLWKKASEEQMRFHATYAEDRTFNQNQFEEATREVIALFELFKFELKFGHFEPELAQKHEEYSLPLGKSLAGLLQQLKTANKRTC